MNYRNIYLILGASSDIGVALLFKLNEEKKDCLFLCHYHSNKDKIVEVVPDNNNEIICCQADFSIRDEVQKFIDVIKDNYGIPTHIIHLQAGQFNYTKLKKFKREQLFHELEIEVYAFIEILQIFLPLMVKNKIKGKIVIMLSSCTISNPPKYMMNYIMTKYTLLGLMKALSVDYVGKNVCINAVSPSMIETKFWNSVDKRLIEQNAKNSINSRNANVLDIVPAILYLLSEDSDYIHGINLNISNGNIL